MTKETRKVALVTGGSRGIGRNTAINLSRKGVDVVITYASDEHAARDAADEIRRAGARCVALQLDTAAPGSFDAFVVDLTEALKNTFERERLDFLVNNAGIGLHKPIVETTEAEFDRLVAVELKGWFFLTQKLLPLISDGGRIVNVSSTLARICLPGMGAYAMMKGAIEVFTRYLAKELGPRKITANTVAPGAIETDFDGGAERNPEFIRLIAGITALGREGVPDDVGPMIAALLSDDNHWVNGQRIEVAGGMYV